jgi:hypothetical protein
MSKHLYEARTFTPAALDVIRQAEQFCEEYARQGYSLTLRQLYYRFIATDTLPESRRDAQGTKNNMRNYKWLGGLVADARVAGMIDWRHITDRTRSKTGGDAGWSSPGDAINSITSWYDVAHWADQPDYLEVWVEKEALVDVISRPATRWRVGQFACKGYVSISEMHDAALRLRQKEREGKATTILHLGDHDPSGLDMTRDIRDRMAMFGSSVKVERLALNMDQIEAIDPPPSPAKLGDSRSAEYIDQYGDDTWELDALEPQFLDDLVDGAIRGHLLMPGWDRAEARQERERAVLTAAADNWPAIEAFMLDEGMTEPPADEDEDEDEDTDD